MYGFTSMAFWCWILVVFIIQCLVLLIFAEGTVKVGSNNYTLKNLFKEAGAEKKEILLAERIFSKITQCIQLISIISKEGKGDSNCKLKFNLPTVPDGSVKVQKQLSNTDKEKYADVKFKFQLLVKDEKKIMFHQLLMVF